jgi:tripartite-type tricarboxylate transporter receptor subunit TctC
MSSLHQRVALAMLALILAGAALPALAEYPEQSIKLVLPFAPGGETDPFARALGTGLTKYLGQPIVIENKPGAGGAFRRKPSRSSSNT